MTCNEIEILLSAYVDGELTEEEKQTVEEHLNACEVCKTTVTEFSCLHTLYQEMEIQKAPPGFRQRVTQRIETTPRLGLMWRLGRLPRLVYGLSFLLLALFSGAIIMFYVMDINHPDQGIDVYAEDILFDQTGFSVNEIFSMGEVSVAEEILETIDFSEPNTSLFFGDEHPSQKHVSHAFNVAGYV